jgi:Flp pilus assembly protein TadD
MRKNRETRKSTTKPDEGAAGVFGARRVSVEPLSFDFSLAEFDLNVLPVDAKMLKGNAAMMRSTLQEHLREMFGRVPGELRITHHEDHISVMWFPETSQDMDLVMDLVIGRIRRQAFGEAETILRTILSRYPDDRRVLFNLGIMLCERGRLQEARKVLKRLTRAAPDFANGWNALGVALSRQGKPKDASSAFRKSLSLDSENGYTLRNLGSLMCRKDPQGALPYLERAAKLLPSDQSAQYMYGKCLKDIGSLADADRVLKKANALNEYSEIADLCREARLEIRRRNLKTAVPRGLRTDVVVFCLAALETFKEVGLEKTQAVVFEIASLGSSGLNIKDRTSRFRLLSLPGEFSALQLVVYMYAGLKKVAPRTDAGIDFSKEYAFARAIFRGKKRK